MQASPLLSRFEMNGAGDRRKKFLDYALVMVAVAALIGFLAAGCGDDDDTPGPASAPAWTGDPLTRTRSGPVSPATVRAVEDAILSRARQLRVADNRL